MIGCGELRILFGLLKNPMEVQKIGSRQTAKYFLINFRHLSFLEKSSLQFERLKINFKIF